MLMVSSTTTTPTDYLASLPQDRREVISTIRDLILENLPEGYQELMDAFDAMGVKPNMGKSCIRFMKLEQLPLDTISRLIAKTFVQDFIEATKTLQN
jgi:hypothetical protein